MVRLRLVRFCLFVLVENFIRKFVLWKKFIESCRRMMCKNIQCLNGGRQRVRRQYRSIIIHLIGWSLWLLTMRHYFYHFTSFLIYTYWSGHCFCFFFYKWNFFFVKLFRGPVEKWDLRVGVVEAKATYCPQENNRLDSFTTIQLRSPSRLLWNGSRKLIICCFGRSEQPGQMTSQVFKPLSAKGTYLGEILSNGKQKYFR